jgi:hypothetical protein
MAGAAELGRDARIVHPGDDQARLGVLLGIGYQGSFLPVFAASPVCPRVIWVGEPLPLGDDQTGGVLTRIARSSAMDHLGYPLRPLKHVPLPGPLARARAAATLERERARNLRQTGLLASSVDRVVVTSRDRCSALFEHGVMAESVPFGYSAAVAGPITSPERGDRDLVFVSLSLSHPRLAMRRAVVERWRTQEPGLTALHGVWGEKRGDLLRRSRIVLNVARTPGEFIGFRLILAIAAGAVVVCEPMTDPFPFVAGVHFVEAPLEGLLDAARELHGDEQRRRRIASAGQVLLAGDLSMARCLSRALGPRV